MALGNIHELVPGVFSVDSRFVDGKNGIVIGKRAALAIDGSNYEDEGAAMASFIRQNGFEPHRLALTHGHGDHILGAGPLAQGEVFAHALTPAEIEKQIPGWAARWEVDEAEARARVIQPTITYQDELRMDLGGLHAWMFPTPGHSPDGVSIYIEEHRLLFAGDSVVTGIVAAIGAGNSEVLERVEGRLVASGHRPQSARVTAKCWNAPSTNSRRSKSTSWFRDTARSFSAKIK